MSHLTPERLQKARDVGVSATSGTTSRPQGRAAETEDRKDDAETISISDASLRPFVRALLALALEIQERERKK